MKSSTLNGWQPESERTALRQLGLPTQILRKPRETYEQGLALVERIKQMEEDLTAWEDSMPLEFLEMLPWWEERKLYREQKALGVVDEVTWWRAISEIELYIPHRLSTAHCWGLREHRWAEEAARAKNRGGIPKKVYRKHSVD